MKPSISFVWQGINERKDVWRDGLWLAMKHLEKEYTIYYQEPDEEIKGDIIMYWEAPCTINGSNRDKWLKIQNNPKPKILLFAGGPIKAEWVKGFNVVCVESKINKEEFGSIGIPAITAFGINEEIMRPMESDIIYDGIHHGTCANWKRQWLVGEALGDKGLVVGRYQENDRMPFDECKKYGTHVILEQPANNIAILLNRSFCCLQTSDQWGGGQRCTLEAMACGVPVICMEDSPKNREYVEESGFGLVVYPNKEEIRKAIEKIKKDSEAGLFSPQVGRDYIMSKWTSKHYAENLKKAICAIQ